VLVFSFQKYAESLAEETKTYTFTEVKTAVFNIPSNVENFLTSEVEKTKAYQKESWADGKLQLQNTWLKLTSWIK
tara:strand:+ start:1777 stop:2001 length:225 start_codon:yes stop_codon:yes gene_type:complete